MKLITLRQLRTRMGGRSRNAIFADVERGVLPRPVKLGRGSGARNYWQEAEVDACIKRLAYGGVPS